MLQIADERPSLPSNVSRCHTPCPGDGRIWIRLGLGGLPTFFGLFFRLLSLRLLSLRPSHDEEIDVLLGNKKEYVVEVRFPTQKNVP